MYDYLLYLNIIYKINLPMDIITQSHLNEFIKSFGYEDDDESKAFEKFANYSIVSKEYPQDTIEPYQIQQITVGDGGDIGLDGIAIIVNGKIVSSIETIDDLLEGNGFLDVTFILTQTKTSPKFEAAQIMSFLNGIDSLFLPLTEENYIHPHRNKDIINYASLVKYIYQKSSRFYEGRNPKLFFFYVTTGIWNDDNIDSKSLLENKKIKLIKSKLFNSVFYKALGSDEIVSLYKETKSKEKAEILFPYKVVMPDTGGIKEAYFGLLEFSEFKKIIIDQETDSLKNVFYDNIRAFQGYNLVNKDIDKILKNKKFDLFTSLNNGVTIIAKTLISSGNKITLVDYQIVNGCQTSHVLFYNRNLKGIDSLQVPLKIISSEDKDVRNKIIIANNSQTEVKREQLIALSEFQEKIEDYYNAIEGKGKLYYERRSKQYKGDLNIPQYKVITIPIQIMAFTSVILEEPHNVRGYYGKIVENLEKGGKAVFAPTNHIALYYMSALAYHRLEKYFQTGKIDSSFRKAKFHLLLAFRLLAEESPRPKSLNDKGIEKYCKPIIKKLNDEQKCLSLFKEASEVMLSTVPNNELLDRFVNVKLSINISRKLGKYLHIKTTPKQ